MTKKQSNNKQNKASSSNNTVNNSNNNNSKNNKKKKQIKNEDKEEEIKNNKKQSRSKKEANYFTMLCEETEELQKEMGHFFNQQDYNYTLQQDNSGTTDNKSLREFYKKQKEEKLLVLKEKLLKEKTFNFNEILPQDTEIGIFNSQLNIYLEEGYKKSGSLQDLIEIDKLCCKLSKLIFRKENRNDFYLSDGLSIICQILREFSSISTNNNNISTNNENLNNENTTKTELIENILDNSLFILYKMSEHTKARNFLLMNGIFYTLWFITLHFKKIKNLNFHANEIMELLGGEISLGFELGNLLYLTNCNVLQSIFLQNNVMDDCNNNENNNLQQLDSNANVFIKLINDKDFLNDEIYLSEESFDIKCHFIILKSRCPPFLQNMCKKWNPLTNEILSNQNGPGYYLLINEKITRFSFFKFLQIIYTDKITIAPQEILSLQKLKKLNNNHNTDSELNISIDSCLLNEGFPQLLTFLKNDKTKIMISDMLNSNFFDKSTNYLIENTTKNSLFDKFDEELLNDELNFFFGLKPGQTLPYYWMSQPQKKLDYSGEFLKRKEKIKKFANQAISLEEDLSDTFREMIIVNPFQHDIPFDSLQNNDLNNDLQFYPDIILTSENEDFGEIDYLILDKLQENTTLQFILKEKCFYVHKAILISRSEFLKKLFQYEEPYGIKNNLQIFTVKNISLSSLFIILQYMYCGVKENNSILYNECLVECFLQADLFLLFGLKKYLEQEICKNIVMENVLDLYYLAYDYNAEYEWKITITFSSEFCEEFFHQQNTNNSIEIVLTKLNLKKTETLIGKIDSNSEGINKDNFTHYPLIFRNPTKSGFFITKYAIACKFIQKGQDDFIKPLLYLEIYSKVPNKYKLIVEQKDNVERMILHLMFQCLNENVISNVLFRRLWAYLTDFRYYCDKKDSNLTLLHKLFKEFQITKEEEKRKEIFSYIIEVPETILGESGLFILCDKYLKIEDKKVSEVILECIRKIIRWLVLDNSLDVNHRLIVKMMKNRKIEIPFKSISLVARLCFELNPIICLQKANLEEVLQVIYIIKNYF
ncbi:hypothetical protein ABK040_006091 [Willaertia magna]